MSDSNDTPQENENASPETPEQGEQAAPTPEVNGKPPVVTATVDGTNAESKNTQAVTYRILVVEDSLPLRRMLCKILETNNCKADEAENGQTALARLNEVGPAKYSAIISDIMMPVMDGPTFIQKAKEKHGADLPPVLICSSRSDREAVQVVMRLGVSGYILKPFKTGTVIEKLRNILEG